MSSLPASEPRGFRRTFVAEGIRAVAAGIIETAFATFAILIAVKQFDSSAAVKAFLLGAPAIGLLGSLILVSLVVKSRLTASRAAAVISLISTTGFAIAALGATSEVAFVTGISIGIGVIGMAIPLQTHYLRLNYPARSRGRLFSVTILIRAFTAMIVSWIFGNYLDEDLSRYVVLLWVFVGAGLISALCHFTVPSDLLRAAGDDRKPFLDSFHLSRKDRLFVKLLGAAMVLGIGVLSANALRVDYLVNPDHGLVFDVKTVSLITGIIPSVMRLGSTFFWGWLFDRVDFFRLRIVVNLIFLLGILLYFFGGGIVLIAVGSALFGLARGGGEILFNLFVTKLAPSAHIADYMSVHTFLAGVRILLAPFLGFFIVTWIGVPTMVAMSGALIPLSVLMVRDASLGRVDPCLAKNK